MQPPSKFQYINHPFLSFFFFFFFFFKISQNSRSMSIIFSSPYIAVSRGRTDINKQPVNQVFMIHKNLMLYKKRSPTLIRSFTADKVFEDQSKGIFCYIDDRGEMICEGYDEGPRFHPPEERRIYCSREQDIVHLLKEARLQMIEESEFRCLKWGISVQQDLDLNDFEKLY